MKQIKVGSAKFNSLVKRDEQGKLRLQKKVAKIIEDVRTEGDNALIRYTKRFDRVNISRKDLRVSEA